MTDPTVLVHAIALKYLTPFVDGTPWSEAKREQLLAVRPRDEDFAGVFKPSMEGEARRLYAQLWSNPPPLVGKPGQTLIQIATAMTEDFVGWTRRGQEFPGGYRKLGPHLQPERAWVAWKFIAPGERAGLSFDGLVWVNERLIWFPQPWRRVPIGGDA